MTLNSAVFAFVLLAATPFICATQGSGSGSGDYGYGYGYPAGSSDDGSAEYGSGEYDGYASTADSGPYGYVEGSAPAASDYEYGSGYAASEYPEEGPASGSGDDEVIVNRRQASGDFPSELLAEQNIDVVVIQQADNIINNFRSDNETDGSGEEADVAKRSVEGSGSGDFAGYAFPQGSGSGSDDEVSVSRRAASGQIPEGILEEQNVGVVVIQQAENIFNNFRSDSENVTEGSGVEIEVIKRSAFENATDTEDQDTEGSGEDKCVALAECVTNADCVTGKCEGPLTGTCDCSKCVSFASCTEDAGCGGLKGACDPTTKRCSCLKGFKTNGFASFLKANRQFCNKKKCSSRNTNECFGLPCNVGHCVC